MAEVSVSKRARFSMEPDVEIVVEGKSFHLHSYVLMSQSPVFRQMLCSDMRESHDGQITLQSKKADEFEEFCKHLQTQGVAAPPEIEPDMAKLLVVWAHEYDVELLFRRCEDALLELNHSDCDYDLLQFAEKFGLLRLRKKCVYAMCFSPYKHRGDLHKLLDQAPLPDSDDEEEQCEEGEKDEADVPKCMTGEPPCDTDKDQSTFMNLVLPHLYDAVHLGYTGGLDDLPSSSSLTVEALWPIVVRAIEMAHGWRDVEEIKAAAMRTLEREKIIMNTLPNGPFLQEATKGMSMSELRERLQRNSDWTSPQNSELHHLVSTLERKQLVVRKANGRMEKPILTPGEKEDRLWKTRL